MVCTEFLNPPLPPNWLLLGSQCSWTPPVPSAFKIPTYSHSTAKGSLPIVCKIGIAAYDQSICLFKILGENYQIVLFVRLAHTVSKEKVVCLMVSLFVDDNPSWRESQFAAHINRWPLRFVEQIFTPFSDHHFSKLNDSVSNRNCCWRNFWPPKLLNISRLRHSWKGKFCKILHSQVLVEYFF